jgi:hypothetical protein
VSATAQIALLDVPEGHRLSGAVTVAAIAGDLDNILLLSFAAVVAAAFRITRDTASATFVRTLPFVRHK